MPEISTNNLTFTPPPCAVVVTVETNPLCFATKPTTSLPSLVVIACTVVQWRHIKQVTTSESSHPVVAMALL